MSCTPEGTVPGTIGNKFIYIIKKKRFMHYMNVYTKGTPLYKYHMLRVCVHRLSTIIWYPSMHHPQT